MMNFSSYLPNQTPATNWVHNVQQQQQQQQPLMQPPASASVNTSLPQAAAPNPNILSQHLSQTIWSFQNLHQPAATQYLANSLSHHSLVLPHLLPILLRQYRNYWFHVWHVMTQYLLDGWEALGDNTSWKESLRRMLVEFILHVLNYMSSDTSAFLPRIPQGENKATLLKCVVVWDRIVLQQLKVHRESGSSSSADAFSLQQLWQLYGIQQYNLTLTWNRRLNWEHQQREARYAILLALAHLPEEASNDHFSHTENISIKHDLHQVAPEVLAFLLEFVSNDDALQFGLSNSPDDLVTELKRCALFAIQKWLQFGVPLELIYNEQFLFVLFNKCLMRKELFNETVDLLLESFLTYADRKHDDFLLKCMDQICTLRPLYEQQVLASSSTVGDDTLSTSPNYNFAHSIARLVVGFAEAQVRLIADRPREPVCMRLVEFVNLCAQNPDLGVCALTFDFWYSLESRLQTDEDQRVFRQVYIGLLQSLVQHVQYNPNDMESKDDVDQFREESKDVFMEPYQLLFGDYFTLLAAEYERALQGNNWARVESLLYALYAVGDICSSDQLNDGFFKIINTFPQLPVRDIALLRSTMCQLLDAYAEVLQRRVSLDFIAWCLNFLLDGVWQFSGSFGNDGDASAQSGAPPQQDGARAELALQTAQCFKNFCEKSVRILEANQASNMVSSLTEACINKMGSLDSVEIVKNIVLGLAHCTVAIEKTAPQQFEQNFALLFGFCEQRLAQALEKSISGVGSKSLNEHIISHDLQVLSNCVRPFDGNNNHIFVLQKVQEVWPLTQRVLNQFAASPDVVEALTSLYFVMFVGVGVHRESQSFLYTMMDLLTQYFQQFLHPPVVRLISFMIDDSVDERTLQLFGSRFPNMCIQILSSVQSQSEEQLKNHGEMIQYLFKLLVKMVHVRPDYLESNRQVLDGIFSLGLAAVGIEQSEVYLQVVQWYTTFLDASVSHKYLKDVGGPLITRLFELILVKRVSHAVYLKRILEYYRHHHPMMLQAFALNVLMRDEFTRIPMDEKRRFVRQYTQSRTMADQQKCIDKFLQSFDSRRDEDTREGVVS